MGAATGLGAGTATAVTAFLPEPGRLPAQPVVCFAFPGGGYCRRYFSIDLPGEPGGQAAWHSERGWIFVACDHLGFGDSTLAEEGLLDRLDYELVALANHATVEAILADLAAGTLVEGYPPVRRPLTIGAGQSMGGCFTIVAQGQHATFDAVAILGYSAIHTVVPSRPGSPPIPWPWIPRTSPLDRPRILNAAALAAASPPTAADGAPSEHPFAWAFHYDDEPAELVAADMAGAAGGDAPLPPWRSATIPACGGYMVAPGTVATEAAAISVPVLSATGERDVVPNPWLEPFAYRSATDVTVFVCPGMAHMHNFAHTRRQLWQRLQVWGDGVAALRSGPAHPAPSRRHSETGDS